MKSKLLAGFIILAVLGVAAVVGLGQVSNPFDTAADKNSVATEAKKSPEQVVNNIYEAIAQKDVKTFEQYVDLKRVTEKALVSAMKYKSEKEGKPLDAKQLDLIEQLKPAVLAEVKEAVMSRVQDGKLPAINAQLLELIRNPVLKEVKTLQADKNNAVVNLKVAYPNLQKTFDVVLVLQVIAGEWKVVEFANIGQLIAEAEAVAGQEIELPKN
ncbi:MAG: hypothetical protein LBR56_09360 [Sporomusaceae bacterium]|nr:hypothetical protein [Sporomusaceae bacterium]